MRAWGNWLDPIDLKSIALCIPVRVRVPAPKNDAPLIKSGYNAGLISRFSGFKSQRGYQVLGDVAEWPKAAGC